MRAIHGLWLTIGLVFQPSGAFTPAPVSLARPLHSSRARTVSSALHVAHTPTKHAVTTTFAGKLWPILKRFLLAPTKATDIARNVIAITHWQDIVLLLAIAYATLPITKLSWMQLDQPENKKTAKFFELSRRYGVVSLFSDVARVALSAYLVDVACVVLRTLGFTFPSLWNIPRVYAKTAYSVWGLRRFLSFKRAALCRLYRVPPSDMGRVDLLDRLISGIAVSLVSLLLFDWLSVQMGLAIKGLFAFGSVGTLAFTLASQGLVSQLLSGFFLTASNKVLPGEKVEFGDGTSGKVMRMGWMETVIRGSDNTITSVPNAKLANQKISNYSRVRVSQVKQTLRFQYENADEIPGLLETMRTEIKQGCPKVILDGSRPFRIFFTNFNEDHLEVMVDTHYRIPPTS